MDKFIDGVGQWFNDVFTWVSHQPELMALFVTCFFIMIILAIMSDS